MKELPNKNKLSDTQKARIEWIRATRRRLKESCQVLEDRKDDLDHILVQLSEENENLDAMISRGNLYISQITDNEPMDHSLATTSTSMDQTLASTSSSKGSSFSAATTEVVQESIPKIVAVEPAEEVD